MKNLAILLLAPLLLAAAPAKEKVLVLPLTAGEGVNEGTAKAITEALLGEVRKRPVAVLSGDDLKAVLSVERQRQLLGCSESSCVAELGGALGADRIVSGSVARLGQSWLIHVQLIDARKATVLAQSDRRKKGGSVDDVLDELPAMAGELFGAAVVRPAPPPVAVAPSAPLPSPKKLPPNGVDVPLPLAPEAQKKLLVLSDEHGHFIALDAFNLDGPFLAGDASALHAQRRIGGGASGTEQFDAVFWEPRVMNGAEAELDLRAGKYTLTCGKHQIAFEALKDKQAHELLAKAKLYDVRWQRQAIAFGRDDDGTYYLVDAPRTNEPPDDLHLYVGKKGQVRPVAVTDVQRERGLLIVQTDAGSLKLPLGDGDNPPPGSFGPSGAARPVTPLDLWRNKILIYTTLGAYTGEPLGTPCDPWLGS